MSNDGLMTQGTQPTIIVTGVIVNEFQYPFNGIMEKEINIEGTITEEIQLTGVIVKCSE